MSKTKIGIKKQLLKRKVNGVVTEGYYGRAITNGTKTYEEITEESSNNTTMHVGEMELAVRLFLDGVSRTLKRGYIVDLGKLGKLYPSVAGIWHTDPDEVTLDELKPKVYYRPSHEIKSAIEGAQLGWTKVAATEENSSDEEPTVTPSNGDDNNGNNNSNTPDPDENLLG